MNGEFVQMGEVARILRLSRPTIRKKLRSGEIPGLTEHYGIQRVKRETFEKWLESKEPNVVLGKLKLARTASSRMYLIYFIEQRHGDRPIKIGFTTTWSLKVRLSKLQVSSPYPLKLLGTIAGGASEERRLHRRFRADRLSGEWFRPSEALLKFLKDKGISRIG